MYEMLRKEVDLQHNHSAPLVLHAAAFDDSGNNVRVADNWKSEEELNSFVSSRLMPVMKKSECQRHGRKHFKSTMLAPLPVLRSTELLHK
jgi:hypothetical protein